MCQLVGLHGSLAEWVPCPLLQPQLGTCCACNAHAGQLFRFCCPWLSLWCSAGAPPATVRSEISLPRCAPAKCSTCAPHAHFDAACCPRALHAVPACCGCSIRQPASSTSPVPVHAAGAQPHARNRSLPQLETPLTLCPRTPLHMQSRSGVLPHMSHRLFQLAGKPVGKAPTPYKPRGPKSPSGAEWGEELDTRAGSAPEAAAAPAAAPAAGSASVPAGPAAGLAAELGAAPPLAAAGQAVGPAAAAAARAAATAEGTTVASGSLEPAQALAMVQAE